MSSSSQFSGGIKSIQRGVIAIANGDVTNTATITAVVTGKTELRKLGGSVGSTGDADIDIVLTNTTTITATRGTTALAGRVSWELTEFF